MGDPVIRLTGISFRYEPERPVFDDLDFELEHDDAVGIVGATGAGKSSLLYLLAGLVKPAAGRIEIFGETRRTEADFRDVRGPVGLLFQDSDDQLFCPTVAEDVAFGPLNLGKSRKEALEIVDRTLTDLGLQGYSDRITYKLSGGEKRLVALATVLAMDPEILLLDEPTTGLDDAAAERVETVLHTLHHTMIVISHDHDLIRRLTSKTYRLENRRLTRVEL